MRAQGWVELPADWPDWRGTMVEPLACVLRGAARVPAGRVLVVGNGFIGRLFGLVLERRGDDVFAADTDPRRAGRAPDGPVDAVVLAGRGGVETALASVKPGGTVLVFADAGAIPAADVYRRELSVVGTRSAAPPYMPEAVALHTDSTYVIRGITEWVHGWRRRGWVTADGKPVLNRELWERLAALVAERGRGGVSWRYVRGHSAIAGNERADEIAVSFAAGRPAALYDGSLLEYPIPIHDVPENVAPPPRRSSAAPRA